MTLEDLCRVPGDDHLRRHGRCVLLLVRHPDPAHAADVHQQVVSRLHLKSKTVESIAPTTAFQALLLWIGISLTAGFCEEHIFREVPASSSPLFLSYRRRF